MYQCFQYYTIFSVHASYRLILIQSPQIFNRRIEKFGLSLATRVLITESLNH